MQHVSHQLLGLAVFLVVLCFGQFERNFVVSGQKIDGSAYGPVESLQTPLFNLVQLPDLRLNTKTYNVHNPLFVFIIYLSSELKPSAVILLHALLGRGDVLEEVGQVLRSDDLDEGFALGLKGY